MTHPVDQMLDEARAAIARMQQAALAARALHASAELMRHMRGTAAKLSHLPLEEAIQKVAGEWMQAWSLSQGAYPELAADIFNFARAFCVDSRGSDTTTQAAVRDAIAALEAGFAAIGTSVADEMAFRSECRHGWWRQVVPARPGTAGPDLPFWAHGALPRCGAE
jgi:hypothetical protein